MSPNHPEISEWCEMLYMSIYDQGKVTDMTRHVITPSCVVFEWMIPTLGEWWFIYPKDVQKAWFIFKCLISYLIYKITSFIPQCYQYFSLCSFLTTVWPARSLLSSERIVYLVQPGVKTFPSSQWIDCFSLQISSIIFDRVSVETLHQILNQLTCSLNLI